MNDPFEKMTVLAGRIADCQICQLHLSRKKSVPGEGNVNSKILFIGEGPGMNENETGRPFVGQAGNFLNELIGIAKLKRSDVFITNVVKCRPPSNRDPLPEELKACAAYLEQQIEIINPLVIVTLGRFSMARYFPMAKVSSVHGKGHWIDNRMIVPMFHPAAALHQPNLRGSIMHDFSLLPSYIEQVETQMNTEAVEIKPSDSEEHAAQLENPESENGVQLSLF